MLFFYLHVRFKPYQYDFGMNICNGDIDTAVPVHKVILELRFFLLCCGAGQYFPLIVTKLLVLFYSAIHIPLTYISGRNSSIKGI